jgi:hypothetical protein
MNSNERKFEVKKKKRRERERGRKKTTNDNYEPIKNREK